MAATSTEAGDSALRPRFAEDEGELGYRVVNPDAPPHEPRVFEPLDPRFQASAEKILLALREKWLKE